MTTPQLGEPQTANDKSGRPREIELSVQFWFASLALNVIGYIVNALSPSAEQTAQMRKFVNEQGPAMAGMNVDDLIRFGQIGSIVLAVVMGGVWLGCILAMRAKHRWARNTLVGLGWLALIVGVQQLGLSTGSALVFLAMSVFTLIAVSLMFRGKAVEFFRK